MTPLQTDFNKILIIVSISLGEKTIEPVTLCQTFTVLALKCIVRFHIDGSYMNSRFEMLVMRITYQGCSNG